MVGRECDRAQLQIRSVRLAAHRVGAPRSLPLPPPALPLSSGIVGTRELLLTVEAPCYKSTPGAERAVGRGAQNRGRRCLCCC